MICDKIVIVVQTNLFLFSALGMQVDGGRTFSYGGLMNYLLSAATIYRIINC